MTATAAKLVAANDNRPARKSAKRAPAVTHTDIRSRDWTRGGRKFEGSADKGHHVIVRAGESVTVLGDGERYVMNVETRRNESRRVAYRTTFKLGDVAVYGGMNLTYTGTVVAIGEKTVKIVDHGTAHLLSLHDFSQLNRFFDLVKIEKRNAEWMD